MITLLSPAKSLDFESQQPNVAHSSIQFSEDTAYLVDKLQNKSARQLKEMMGISDALAQLNAERYQTWQDDYRAPYAKQAALAFNGDVYHGLQFDKLTKKQMEYAQGHLRILSGIYGVLRPLDMIQPYRLEMGTKWAVTAKKTNLYKYWGDRLTKNIQSEIHETGAKFVLNLASNEYSKVIDFKKLSVPTITPEFREEKGNRFQMISFFAKKARGLMAAYVIKNKIEDVDALVAFDTEGYTFNESLSNREKNKWVFTRKSE
jgi:cytoplasmic iron level regulating protein YaaA (DUF328/UPF0246 family)